MTRGPVPAPEGAERTWRRRYIAPQDLFDFAETSSAGPYRDLFRAYRARREGRMDEAMSLLIPLTESAPFDDLWTARLWLVQCGILEQLGLSAEALTCVERALECARRSGDATAIAFANHDWAAVTEDAEPVAALQRYADVYRRTTELSSPDPDVELETEAVAALTLTNIYFLTDRTSLPLPRRLPGPEEVQARTDRAWPSLGHAFRSFRGMTAATAGRADEARALLTPLPDPRSMIDTADATRVAIGWSTLLVLEGRHDDALAMLDTMKARLQPKHALDILPAVATVHADRGDYEAAYKTMLDLSEVHESHFGEANRIQVRALEVWYRTDRLAREAAEAQAAHDRLAEQAELLREEGLRDPLTGLWNRRHLIAWMDERAGSTGHQVAMVDLDRFKGINDTFGHDTGDRTLIAVAEALLGVCDPADLCFRLGGDEFAVVRPRSVDGDLGVTLARAAARGGADPRFPFSLSIGVAPVGADGFQTAFAIADRAMYEVKRSGGGAVRVADENGLADDADAATLGRHFGLRRRHDDPEA